jgi:hypothetical protein
MGDKNKFILIIIVCILPVYLVTMYYRVFDLFEYNIHQLFRIYLPFVTISLLSILLLNKYFLRKSIKFYNATKGTPLTDITISFLLIAIYYVSLCITYLVFSEWMSIEIDKSGIIQMIRDIYSDPGYTAILMGVFIPVTEGFWVISSVFVLQNLWSFEKGKSNDMIYLFIFALFSSTINIQNGLEGIVFWFLVSVASYLIYYKYRKVIPLIITYCLVMYFDIISLFLHFMDH